MAAGGNDKYWTSFPLKNNCGYKQKLLDRRKFLKQQGFDQQSTKVISKLSDTVLNGFEVLWRQHLLCDVTIATTSTTFTAHKLVLVSCSDYFYDLFVDKRDKQIDEVVLYEINSSIMALILECMYTGKIKLTETNVNEILRSATDLGFFIVQEACEEFLIETMNIRNCLQMLDIAFKFALNKLSDKALEIAAKNFKHICKKPGFKELPIEQVLALFKRDDIETEDEIEIFINMVEWIEHRKQVRLSNAADLFASIRLPLLSPATIVDTVESVTFLMDIPECQTLVKEALHYHCMPARQSVLQSPRTLPRRKVKKTTFVIVGGSPRLKADKVRNEVWRFNPQTMSCDQMTQLPEACHHHAVAVLGGFMYVAGGETTMEKSAYSSSVYRYDPRHNSWCKVESMLNNRQSFQMVSVNGLLFVIGGRIDENNSTNSVEKYDPMRNRWEEMAPLGCPRKCVAAAVLNGRIYVAGGSGKKTVSGTVECYSPTHNKWQSRKAIIHPRFFAHLVPVRGHLYLIGGAFLDQDGNIKCVESVEKYTPISDTWANVCQMRTPRSEFGCALLDSKIYVVAGFDWNAGERLTSVEFLDTDSNIWTEVRQIETSLTGLACCTVSFFDEQNTEHSKKTNT